jgi:cation diffusion facilitator family transporter
MAKQNARRVMLVALAANLAIAAAKSFAAAMTGSSAMLSEALHSVADSSNQVLLLYGARRAKSPPDAHHPFGYGREIYFWSFVVAVVIFALGAGVSLIAGVRRILEQSNPGDFLVSYAVLLTALGFEGWSWATAMREFRKEKGQATYFEAAHRSKDPRVLIALCEDSAAITGVAIALLGTALTQWLGVPWIDGASSLAIALVMAAVALFLAYEIRGLLIGEPADPETLADIEAMMRRCPAVRRVNRLWSVHLGPSEVLLAASVDLAGDVPGQRIEAALDDVQRDVKRRHPLIRHFFVELKNLDGPDHGRADGDAAPAQAES